MLVLARKRHSDDALLSVTGRPVSQALVYLSAAAWIGGAGVTSTTGLPIPATTVVTIPLTGAEFAPVYAVTGTTATVSYFFVS